MTEVDSTADICEWARGFHLYNPEVQQDPYPWFARLRQECPVARSDQAGGFWVISRYPDLLFIFQHPELFSNAEQTIPHVEDPMGSLIPSMVDPPDHTAYRKILSPSFVPAAIKKMEPTVRARAAALLEPIAEKGGCDFLRDFAVPLPCSAFAEMMGLPAADLPMLLEWKEEALHAGLNPEPGAIEAALMGVRSKIISYFQDMYSNRAKLDDPGEDLVGVLVKGQFKGERPLTVNEFLRTCYLLFVAGLDTVTGQLSMAVTRLGRDLALRDELTTDPSLIASAVEELMRYDSTVNLARKVTADVEVGGVQMKRGDKVLLLMTSGSRDEQQFPGADEIDIRRFPNQHFGFGAGRHRCIGSHLARMELTVALEEMHRLIPGYRVDETKPARRHLEYTAGYDQLHLVVD